MDKLSEVSRSGDNEEKENVLLSDVERKSTDIVIIVIIVPPDLSGPTSSKSPSSKSVSISILYACKQFILFICPSVCACLSACLPACLFACLCVSLPVCLPSCLTFYQFTCVPIYLSI